MSFGIFLIIAVAFCAACVIGLLAGIVLEYFAVWDEEGDPTPLPVKPQVFYEDAGGSLKVTKLERIERRQHSRTDWFKDVEDVLEARD
jgi:hypothetical protein